VNLRMQIPRTGKPDPDDLMDEGDTYFEGANRRRRSSDWRFGHHLEQLLL
jgi:hypothetical protein